MTADKINKGGKARIEDLQPSPLTLHLMEMGFLPGKHIEFLHQAPLQGPIAFQIENSVIALRLSEARLIQVQLEH